MKFYWHIHHDILVGSSPNIQERIEYIKLVKPAKEIKIRLRLLKPVRGKLPSKLTRAWAAYDKAAAAYKLLWTTSDQACDKAWAAYNKTRAALDKARDEARPMLEALHESECPNCPWNGVSIFSKRTKP